MQISDLEVFTMTDQPETCGQCGSRTKFIQVDERSQLHVCLRVDCQEIFVVEEDDDGD